MSQKIVKIQRCIAKQKYTFKKGDCRHTQETVPQWGLGFLSFIFSLIKRWNICEDNWKKVEISQNCCATHFYTKYGCSWNCHGANVCRILCVNEHIKKVLCETWVKFSTMLGLVAALSQLDPHPGFQGFISL